MKKRRLDLLKKRNSKIVLVETKESETIIDLANKANDVFLKLKKSAGVTLDYKSVDEMIRLWNFVMIKTSDTLEKISEKVELEYSEPASIALLKEIMENSKK